MQRNSIVEVVQQWWRLLMVLTAVFVVLTQFDWINIGQKQIWINVLIVVVLYEAAFSFDINLFVATLWIIGLMMARNFWGVPDFILFLLTVTVVLLIYLYQRREQKTPKVIANIK